MPQVAWLWAIGIILLCAIAGLAIWLGRGGKFSISGKALTIETTKATPADAVTVARDTAIDGKAGNIVGRRGAVSAAGTTDVASGLTVGERGTVGDIVGVDATGSGPGRKPTPRT